MSYFYNTIELIIIFIKVDTNLNFPKTRHNVLIILSVIINAYCLFLLIINTYDVPYSLIN